MWKSFDNLLLLKNGQKQCQIPFSNNIDIWLRSQVSVGCLGQRGQLKTRYGKVPVGHTSHNWSNKVAQAVFQEGRRRSPLTTQLD